MNKCKPIEKTDVVTNATHRTESGHDSPVEATCDWLALAAVTFKLRPERHEESSHAELRTVADRGNTPCKGVTAGSAVSRKASVSGCRDQGRAVDMRWGRPPRVGTAGALYNDI